MHSLKKLLPSAGIAVVIGGLLISTLFSSTFSHSAKADVTNDVQYSTVLDYSATNILLEQSGFTASTTYECTTDALTCTQVPSNTTSLSPSSLINSLNATTYFSSPDYSEVLASFTNNQVPTEKLYSIKSGALVLDATLPTLNAPVTNVHWSGNDSVLIIHESDNSLQKYNLATQKLTSLTSTLPSGAAWITVSEDGRYLAYYTPAVVSTGIRTLGVIDTTNDTSYTLTEKIGYWDLLSEGVRLFAFSPDSTHLLYLDDRSGYQTLYNVDLTDLPATSSNVTLTTPGATATGATVTSAIVTSPLAGTQVTSKPYAIEDMQWENNSTIVFTANRTNPLQWSLYELNLNTYALNKITDWAAYDQPMQTFGHNIIFQTADANGRITKVFNTITKAVTTFQLPGVSDSIVGTTNKVVDVDGLYSVYMPTTTATTTLLVWLHGGPDRQSSIEYNSYMSYGGYDWVLDQVKAAGVPVLKIDYPGSVGQSYAFASSVEGGVGTVDASSTMQTIKDFAAAHGFKNIYLMGNSYGGYLALKLQVSYPNQIQGVLALSAVTDWQTLLTNIPSSIFSIDFNGSPDAANQSLYDKASIINNLSALGNQKVIVIQGNADTEVPYEQSELLDKALVAANKNVEYYTLDGEDHIYEQPSSYTLVCNKAFELIGLPSSSTCVMQ